jgi:hypothetical protein
MNKKLAQINSPQEFDCKKQHQSVRRFVAGASLLTRIFGKGIKTKLLGNQFKSFPRDLESYVAVFACVAQSDRS